MARKNDNVGDNVGHHSNAKANDDPQDDSDLFRTAMAEIKVAPYQQSRKQARNNFATSAPKPAVKIRKARSTEPAAGGVMTDKTDQGEYVEFARSGLQKKVVRKLKRGAHDFSAILDLHGHTTAESQKLLADFLRSAKDAGDSMVLIIHGKGLHSNETAGVLKRFTLHWLKRQNAVKAFCSALPRDGGTGAVYVLL